MERTRNSGGVVAESGWTRRLHARGISAKQRIHLAAFLILLIAAPLLRAQDIEFEPHISEAEFTKFSRLLAQGIYATPVDPARARGLLGFDIGIAVTAVPVDTSASYWQLSTGDDFSVNDYVLVPRIVASKGLSKATISAMYSKVQSADIEMWGGALDVPLLSGGMLSPTLAIRGAYSTLQGSDVYDLKTYGAEIFLSKGFGPVTPYIAAGRMKLDASGTAPATSDTPVQHLHTDSSLNRYTVGVKISLLLPKIVIEATQAEERSYAAKISFGL